MPRRCRRRHDVIRRRRRNRHARRLNHRKRDRVRRHPYRHSVKPCAHHVADFIRFFKIILIGPGQNRSITARARPLESPLQAVRHRLYLLHVQSVDCRWAALRRKILLTARSSSAFCAEGRKTVSVGNAAVRRAAGQPPPHLPEQGQSVSGRAKSLCLYQANTSFICLFCFHLKRSI